MYKQTPIKRSPLRKCEVWLLSVDLFTLKISPSGSFLSKLEVI